MLFGNGQYQCTDGGEHTQDGYPHRGIAVEGIGAYLGLGRLDVDNVVLLQVEIGALGDGGIVQVEVHHVTAAYAVFAQQLYIIAYGEEGHIARLCQSFEQGDFLVVYSIGTWFVNFAQYAEFVVGAADGNQRGFFQIRLELFTQQGFALAGSHAGNFKFAQYGEVNHAFVVYQILEQIGVLHTYSIVACYAFVLSQLAVERSRCRGVGGTHYDGKQVLGHDTEIVQLAFYILVDNLVVTQVN